MRHPGVDQLAPALAALLLLTGCKPEPAAWPYTGTLERDRIEIRAEAAETIIELPAREGDVLAADAPIAQQDDRRAHLREQAAQAELERLGAQLEELLHGPRSEVIAEARARRARAASLRLDASQQLARVKALVVKGSASEAERERAEAQQQAAQADVEAADANLAALLAGTRPETLAMAQAAVESARVQLESARFERSRLSVRAPKASMVERVLVEVGDRPLAGEVIALLVPQTPPYARVYLPSSRRAGLVPGAQCEVQLAHGLGTLPGRLRWMAGEAGFTPYYALAGEDAGRASFLAEIDLVGAAMDLPVGLPVTARCADAP